MADFKERRNLRITSSFMTRSDLKPMNCRTLRMPSVTCFLEQRRQWAWFRRHTMRILLVNVVGVTCINFCKASLPVQILRSAAAKKLSCVKLESPGITASVGPSWRTPCFTSRRWLYFLLFLIFLVLLQCTAIIIQGFVYYHYMLYVYITVNASTINVSNMYTNLIFSRPLFICPHWRGFGGTKGRLSLCRFETRKSPWGIWESVSYLFYRNYYCLITGITVMPYCQIRHMHLLPCLTRSLAAKLCQCLMHNFVHVWIKDCR